MAVTVYLSFSSPSNNYNIKALAFKEDFFFDPSKS